MAGLCDVILQKYRVFSCPGCGRRTTVPVHILCIPYCRECGALLKHEREFYSFFRRQDGEDYEDFTRRLLRKRGGIHLEYSRRV